MAYPDLWGEGTALISISAIGGSDVQFAAAVPSIDIDMGDKEFDMIQNIRGGQMKKRSPEDVTTITFEGYPVNLDTTSTDVIQRFFVKYASWDATQPLAADNELLSFNDFRVIILWTQDLTVTTAQGLVPVGSEALRLIAKKCQLVSVKPSFTDNELKWTFKFKCVAHSKTAASGGPFETGVGGDDQSNLRWQSTSSAATLAAIGVYATT